MQFDLVSCTLSERDKNGFVRCQPDPLGSPGKGTSPTREAFLPFGLGGRPKAPEKGVGCNLLVLRHGDDVYVIPGHDPRWMPTRPDFGDGGAPLCATTELNGSKVSPYVAFFGEGAAGGEAEGLFRIFVPSAIGNTKIEVDPASGDVSITHPGGAVFVVKAASVELGAAAGGTPLALATPLVSWITGVLLPALASAPGGPITVTPPSGIATTKVNGT